MESQLNKQIGERLRKCRSQLGLSRAAVSERMGIAATAIQAHEEGRNGVKPEIAVGYCSIYKITVQWLYTGRTPEANEIALKIADQADRENWLNMGRSLASKK